MSYAGPCRRRSSRSAGSANRVQGLVQFRTGRDRGRSCGSYLRRPGVGERPGFAGAQWEGGDGGIRGGYADAEPDSGVLRQVGERGPQYLDASGATYNDWAWSTAYADTSTYDSCASLSWIVLPIEGGTASSPYQIMLFHHGEYIGVTSDQMIGFFPEVERLDDETIQVTYKWPRDGETTAGASGRSVSVFTWDGITRAVVHSGEWPPTIDE